MVMQVGNMKIFRTEDGKYQDANKEEDITVTVNTVEEFLAALVPAARKPVIVKAYLGKTRQKK